LDPGKSRDPGSRSGVLGFGQFAGFVAQAAKLSLDRLALEMGLDGFEALALQANPDIGDSGAFAGTSELECPLKRCGRQGHGAAMAAN
jgi:hypothetical protein